MTVRQLMAIYNFPRTIIIDCTTGAILSEICECVTDIYVYDNYFVQNYEYIYEANTLNIFI